MVRLKCAAFWVVALIGGRLLKQGGVCIRVKRVIGVKFQNFVLIFFQITLNNYYYDILPFSRATSRFHCFIVCILFPYAFQFSYGYVIVKFLLSLTFWSAAFIKKGRLLNGGVYFELILKRCGEIRYGRKVCIKELHICLDYVVKYQTFMCIQTTWIREAILRIWKQNQWKQENKLVTRDFQ